MVVPAKIANRFQVHFDSFGNGNKYDHLSTHVLRVTRPHLLMYDSYDVPGVEPIEIDLWDDEMDVTRTEVFTQLMRQITEKATFAMVIETIDQNDLVLEHWHLAECRIIDCLLDELTFAREPVRGDGLRIRLSIEAKQISVALNGQMVSLLDPVSIIC